MTLVGLAAICGPRTPAGAQGRAQGGDGARAVPPTAARIPSGNVHAIDADPRVPSRLHAATASGVLESRDGGASWNTVPVGGARDEAFAVAVGAGLARLFAGRRDGLWRSDDGGRSWSLMPPAVPPGVVPVAIAVAASRPDVVYVATARDGVFRSDDGGHRWAAAGGGLPRVAGRAVQFRTLAVHPLDPDVVYAAHEVYGVYGTTTAGADWSPLNGGLLRIGSGVPPPRLAFDPGDPRRLFMVLPQRLHSALVKTRVLVLAPGSPEWRPLPVGLPDNIRLLAVTADAARRALRVWSAEGAWDVTIPAP